jgi:magnesium transporter
MIRTQLLTANGDWLTGNEELIERWRNEASGYIWIDLEGERPADEKAIAGLPPTRD